MKRSPENQQPEKKSKVVEESGDGFLSRWSQRKRGAAAESDEAVESPALAESLLQEELAPNEPSIEETGTEKPGAVDSADAVQQVLTDADMPDIETLGADSDFSPFFSEGVTKELRNKALKKLFFSGKFAARDGLDDYDDDFTYFEPLGDTVTSDMKFHQRRKEKARLAALEAEEAEKTSQAEQLAEAEQEQLAVAEEESVEVEDTTEQEAIEEEGRDEGAVVEEDLQEDEVLISDAVNKEDADTPLG